MQQHSNQSAFESTVLDHLSTLAANVQKNSDEVNEIKVSLATRSSEVATLRQILDILQRRQDEDRGILTAHTTLLVTAKEQLIALSEIVVGKTGRNGLRATVISHDRRIWLALGGLAVISSLLAWFAPHIAIAASLK
jgi:chromosome segregation ATPase